MTRFVRFAPLVILLLVIGALVWRLATPADRTVRSQLEGKPLPAFTLAAALTTKPGIASTDRSGPRLINIFASWCVPCVAEVGVLTRLRREGVAIDGVAVRDRPEDIARFLRDNGDPYRAIGSDPQSAVQIALGSSGVPESFIVDRAGIIRYQHIGPITDADVPALLAKLRAAR